MNGLEAQFSDAIDFVWLNVDDSSTLPMRQEYGIVSRSNYRLIDENNNIVLSWFGPLHEPSIKADVAEWLAAQG